MGRQRAIDEEAFSKLNNFDVSKPVPSKDIEFQEYPKMVYKHPSAEKAFRKQRTKNIYGEWTDEQVPREAASRVVGDRKELEKALKEGFTEKHYVAPAPPSADED